METLKKLHGLLMARASSMEEKAKKSEGPERKKLAGKIQGYKEAAVLVELMALEEKKKS